MSELVTFLANPGRAFLYKDRWIQFARNGLYSTSDAGEIEFLRGVSEIREKKASGIEERKALDEGLRKSARKRANEYRARAGL